MRYFLYGIFALTLLSPAVADECGNLSKQFQGTNAIAHNSSDARLVKTIESVTAKAHLPEPYLVCEWSTGSENPTAGALISNKKNEQGGVQYIFAISKELLENVSDAGLRGVVAHELAHVSLGYGAAHFQSWILHNGTNKEGIRVEADMDTRAARWVGAQAVLEGVTAAMRIKSKSLSKDPQEPRDRIIARLWKSEYELRRKALIALGAKAD